MSALGCPAPESTDVSEHDEQLSPPSPPPCSIPSNEPQKAPSTDVSSSTLPATAISRSDERFLSVDHSVWIGRRWVFLSTNEREWPYLSTEMNTYDDDQRRPQSLESFMRAVWVKLPAELKRMIFCVLVGKLTQAYYNSDRQKLSRLSLSSRAWCRIFRPPLFEILQFNSKYGTALAAQCRMLYSILNNSTSRWLIDHIRTITVTVVPSHSHPLSAEVHEPIFAALLGIVRGLRELSLISHASDSLLVDQPLLLSWRQRIHSLQHLRSLHMDSCVFPSFSGLMRFLAALPSLQHVIFSHATWGSEDSQPRQWRPHICNSSFHQIQSIHLYYSPPSFATFIPSWIFATASTHFQHSRRQQSQVDPSDLVLTPQSEIMQIAALFEEVHMANDAPSVGELYERKWEKVHSDEDSYTFHLTRKPKHFLGAYRRDNDVTFETRPSPVAGNALLSQTWAVHRVTLSCQNRLHKYGSLFSDPMPLSRDTITSVLSLSTSLQIFEIEYREVHAAELLSVVRKALVDSPSWQLEVNATLESGEFSKLRIVRQG